MRRPSSTVLRPFLPVALGSANPAVAVGPSIAKTERETEDSLLDCGAWASKTILAEINRHETRIKLLTAGLGLN
jgi:hypothetical protein